MPSTIVISGCSSGFGRALALRLASEGDRVYATMRAIHTRNAAAAAELRQIAHDQHLDLRVLEMDVTLQASVAAAAGHVLTESGAPDVLVNNAGQMYVGLAEAYSGDEFAAQLDINVVGVHRVSCAFLPAMRQRGKGLLVNLSSTAGRIAVPFFGIYHASKWALEGYAQALRAELASSGVDLVVVEPGPAITGLFSGARAPADGEGRAATYPPIVHQAERSMQAAFDSIFRNPDAPTDAGLVVERVVELIRQAPGTRPFRNVVGIDFGVPALNEFAEQHAQGLLESMGMREFARLKPRPDDEQ